MKANTGIIIALAITYLFLVGGLTLLFIENVFGKGFYILLLIFVTAIIGTIMITYLIRSTKDNPKGDKPQDAGLVSTEKAIEHIERVLSKPPHLYDFRKSPLVENIPVGNEDTKTSPVMHYKNEDYLSGQDVDVIIRRDNLGDMTTIPPETQNREKIVKEIIERYVGRPPVEDKVITKSYTDPLSGMSIMESSQPGHRESILKDLQRISESKKQNAT